MNLSIGHDVDQIPPLADRFRVSQIRGSTRHYVGSAPHLSPSQQSAINCLEKIITKERDRAADAGKGAAREKAEGMIGACIALQMDIAAGRLTPADLAAMMTAPATGRTVRDSLPLNLAAVSTNQRQQEGITADAKAAAKVKAGKAWDAMSTSAKFRSGYTSKEMYVGIGWCRHL